MNNKDNNKLFELYTIAELAYKYHFKNLTDKDLFPPEWYEYKNYYKKIEIISEAIENNTFISNTQSYLNTIRDII